VRALLNPTSLCKARAVNPTDTSGVERSFSIMNNIHQDKQRNGMSQEMLDSHLHIRSGVESKENKRKCCKCQEDDPPPHCHCTIVEITQVMREKCAKAWSKCKASQQEASAEKAEVKETLEKKKEKYENEESMRIKKLKDALSKRPNFCSPSLMKPVYSKEKGMETLKENKKSETGGHTRGKEKEKNNRKKDHDISDLFSVDKKSKK
jgi:hypothetical protein